MTVNSSNFHSLEPQLRWTPTALANNHETLTANSSSRFFCVASQISNPITQLTATVLIAPCFSKRQSEFQFLELVAAFNKA